MALIAFVHFEFTIYFSDGNMRVAPMEVTNPRQFLFGMCVWVLCVGAMGFIHQGFRRAVIGFIPTHKRGFGNFVETADEGDILFLAIATDGMDAGLKFMWQISFDVCYTGHGDETSLVMLWLLNTF
ncbi:hypothetical protein TAMA11512_17390 [Selenomonas sp. TAMA-11512]|nr:hypothetical protein TAMA11512_17390 [Selenomonas sp. TAMA-11512]